MSDFYISCRYDRMIKALKKLGLDVNEKASKHTKAECFTNKEKTTVPRHPSKGINKRTVKNICDFLLAKGYPMQKILEVLEIKK